MRNLFIPLVFLSILLFSCGQAGNQNADSVDDVLKSLDHNKKIATLYHELNTENIDEVFAPDFKGHGEYHDWDLESHRKYLSNERFKVDSIIQQVAEGDWVATWFQRTGDTREGEKISTPIMHFKRFKDGKIVELWEYYDYDPEPEE
ncbi:MAG: hypothetical protein AMS26_22425 [Bacteroides sp. SM23_62]|nr:MAG: hypothetical protein AMS26_22425 [Bacteroides sp. SM23_62]